MKTAYRIPISDAKHIGNERKYTQVIIVAFDRNTSTTAVCTWGENKEECAQAADGGNFVKKALGWPPEHCNAMPSRMKSYGQKKWEEACEAMWKHINEVMGDQTVDESIKLIEAGKKENFPPFKP